MCDDKLSQQDIPRQEVLALPWLAPPWSLTGRSSNSRVYKTHQKIAPARSTSLFAGSPLSTRNLELCCLGETTSRNLPEPWSRPIHSDRRIKISVAFLSLCRLARIRILCTIRLQTWETILSTVTLLDIPVPLWSNSNTRYFCTAFLIQPLASVGLGDPKPGPPEYHNRNTTIQ